MNRYENVPKARVYAPGIGDAVANRTINRNIEDKFDIHRVEAFSLPRNDETSLDDQIAAWAKDKGLTFDDYEVVNGDGDVVSGYIIATGISRRETWEDVSIRVARGNSVILEHNGFEGTPEEQIALEHHLRQATTLMSGRHLQHGDEDQPIRPMEVFTNCFDGSQKIITMEHGAVEIGSIAGEVVTVLAGDGVLRKATINEHGEQDVFDVTFRSVMGGGGKYRKSVRVTENHRWILRDGSVTTALAMGDVLKSINSEVKRDPVAVVHGLIYGDGTAHKTRIDTKRKASQGRTYASIRVCKSDVVKDTIHTLLDEAGYNYTTPPHADGDRVYYLGKLPYVKDVPFTNDPEYIAGFIHGWWLADGYKSEYESITEISTISETGIQWLKDYAALAGYNVTMHRVQKRKEGDGSYSNGKPLHTIRLRKNVEWKVDSITPAGKAKVFCPEEPVTQSFVLANGLLTGNCSTSAFTSLLFVLLLSGSGVGRDYTDDMIIVDYKVAPELVCVIDNTHADVLTGEINIMTCEQAEHLYAGKKIHIHVVEDSREGWGKATEIYERMTFDAIYSNDILILDFSLVRCKGSPIKGMQDRPASGPGPLIEALNKIAKIKHSGMEAWKMALYADHFLAECVLVGGARRAARMSTKHWRDKNVFDFIRVKAGGKFLWSSNNSVLIDDEFRTLVTRVFRILNEDGIDFNKPKLVRRCLSEGAKLWAFTELEAHAAKVFLAVADASYHDGTGEPGFINVDRLTADNRGLEDYVDGFYAESSSYQLDEETIPLAQALAKAAISKSYSMITNPCGEIALSLLGAYCTIADVVPYHAQRENLHEWDAEAEDAFRVSVRALMRVNLMDCLYKREVDRTNRIGIGMTGLHEYAWARFGFGWRDIVDEEKSKEFWLMLSRFKRAVKSEAIYYAGHLSVAIPHTDTTMKPAGTTSKLFGLTEGAHLASMREYLRWVQFRSDDPMIAGHEANGYPIRTDLKTYPGTTIVGFPTQPMICSLGMGDKLVTAAEATPEEQYQYLRLLEKYWITGVATDGVTPLQESGNQVSYTLKYDPAVVGFGEFVKTMLEGQFDVRCCSVMPGGEMNTSSYEYLPEEPITKHGYELIMNSLKVANQNEDISFEHIDCGAGGCPVDFNEEVA